MIAASDIMFEVRQRGVDLWVDGDFLRFKGPKGAITEELRARLVEHKAEILSRLKSSGANAITSKTAEKRGYGTGEVFENPLDLADILSFPTRLLSGLPLPPTLILSVTGITEPVAFDFRPRSNSWRRQPEPRRPTFDLTEIGALVEAFEQGRAAKRFALWCQQKQREPSWRLTREVALQGANGLIAKPPKPKGWTLDRLLSAIGATLRLIKLDSGGAQTGKRGPYSEVSND